MKQVKLNLNEELESYLKSQEGHYKKDKNLMRIGQILFTAGISIGSFLLGSKCLEYRINRGWDKIFINDPNVKEIISKTLEDYCLKNNIKW